jgi:predicted dehydrogenase
MSACRAASAGPEDIVIVAVPPWLHAKMSILALRAGFHVLCEKPFARTRAELDEILAAALVAGRHVGDCSVRFNAQPSMVRAREILDSGELGALNLVRMVNRRPRMRPGIEYQPASRWFLSREKSGGGVLMDWAVYDVAMLFDVLRPKAVTVRSAWIGGIDGRDDPVDVPIEVESHAVAMMELLLADGQTLPFLYERANGVNGPPLAELGIEGRHGGLSWQWLPPYEEGTVTMTAYVDVSGRLADRVERLPMQSHPHFHHLPLLALANRIAGRASASLDPADIRFNFDVLTAVYEVAAMGGSATVRRGQA